MIYPESLKLDQLQSTSESFKRNYKTLQQVEDLAGSPAQITPKAKQYLRRKQDEDDDTFQERVDNFTFYPILNTALNHQASKLASETLSIAGIDGDDFWGYFRENINGAGQDESSFIYDSYLNLNIYQTVYALIDKPSLKVQIINKAQEVYLRDAGINIDPYVLLFSPLDVISESEKDGKLQWVKIRQIEEISNPINSSLYLAIWTFADDIYIAKYQSYVVLKKDNSIDHLVDKEGKPLKGDLDKVPRTVLVEHKRGRVPVVKRTLPISMWSGAKAYRLMLEHLIIHNGLADTTFIAGHVQRTWNPPMFPDDNINSTYTNAEDMMEKIKSGNRYVWMGEMAFNEVKGDSINSVDARLQRLENLIKEIVAIGGGSLEKGALQQSGVSKSMDFVREESVLKSFGQILTGFYQDVIQQVAIARGYTENLVKSVSVQGLDSFSLSNLEDYVEQAKQLIPIEDKITTTSKKFLYSKIESLLNPNLSAQEKAQLSVEQEELWNNYNSETEDNSSKTED